MQYLFPALFGVAGLLLFAGGIMFVVAAFRVSVVWGLCVLFLGPVALVFLIMHWEEAKRAFGIQMLGMLLAFGAIFSGMGSAGPAMQRLTQSLARTGLPEAKLEALQNMAEEERAAHSRADEADMQPSGAGRKLSRRNPASLVGATLDETREALGRPKGELKSGAEICLLYDKFAVFSTDGITVSSVDTGDHKPGTTVQSTHTPSARARAGSSGRPVRMISNGGQRVDRQKLVMPGKITVVDFYADWCGPCRRMGPHLEQIARSDPEVVLYKVDIVNWETPVVKQYRIRSIPNVHVYNRNGVAVGRPSPDLNVIRQNIERAR